MALALDAGNVDQGAVIDDRRSAKQRPRNQYLVLARELPDQPARRIGNQRQPLCQLNTRGNFGVRNEVDQNTVEQIDVIGPQSSRRLQVQIGDPARCLGAAIGIAVFDDLIKPGDQRGCALHQMYPNRPQRRVFRNLSWLGEGRVRSGTEPKTSQNAACEASRALPDCGKIAISAATYGSHTIAY
jgi:hypothetical protein